MERFFRDGFGGDIFRFDLVPPGTDRPSLILPDVLLEGLDAIPFQEFFADGEVTPREREALRRALDEWLNGLLERFDTPPTVDTSPQGIPRHPLRPGSRILESHSLLRHGSWMAYNGAP